MVKKRRREPVAEGPPDVPKEELNKVLASSTAVPAVATYNGAKLALELLESATTQLVRRMGWFRDIRLRRAADAFLRSSRLHQQAKSYADYGDGQGFEKPTYQQIQ